MQSTGERDGKKSLSSKEAVLTKGLSGGFLVAGWEGPEVAMSVRGPRSGGGKAASSWLGWEGALRLNIKSQRTVLCSDLRVVFFFLLSQFLR